MALESVSLKGDDESFMADDLEDGEILDEEDEVPQIISTIAQAEDEKKAKSEGSGNTPVASDIRSNSITKEQLKNDDSKVPPTGINDKGTRRSSNEGIDLHSDDDSRRKKKKKKKRHRESDDDERSKDPKRQKRSHHRKRDEENGERVSTKHSKAEGEEEEDDEEMMFVRGASPNHGKPRGSSSSHGHRQQRKHSRERHRSSPLLQTPTDFPAVFSETSPLNSSRSSHRHSSTHRRSRSPHNRPYRRISRSPTAGHEGGQFEDHYESYDSDYERDSTHFRRGVGRVEDVSSRRGIEDRLGTRKRRGRGVLAEGSTRGGGRGAGPGKRLRKGEKRGGGRGEVSKSRRPERSGSICMFFMQGKCQKGEECPYSHDATPPRKLELCKFYLMDCCAKKEKCLYMHKDFPCKYYHTGMKCFSGDNCKFSHGPLDDCLKAILLKHLETAPKEILGDFPRLTREGAAAMVMQQSGDMEERSDHSHRDYSHGRKSSNLHSINYKIPSLFEIDIPMPDEVENGEVKGKDDGSRGDEEEKVKGKKSEKREEGRMQHRLDGEERRGHHHHHRGEEEKKREGEEQEEEEEGRVEEEEEVEEDEEEEEEEEDTREGMGGEGKLSIVCDEEEEREEEMKGVTLDKGGTDGEAEEEEEDDSRKESGDSISEPSEPVNIPLHLPKKQRELFMRIQQQQREAESSQDPSGENEDEEDGGEKEENWYSSDEEAEDRSLTDVLKNLSNQPPGQADKAEAGSASTEKVENGSAPTENKLSINSKVLEALSLGDLSQISITPDISKLLSTIREGATAAGSQSPQTSTTSDSDSRPPVRDPRRVVSRDPRQRSAAPEVSRDPRTKPVMLSPRPQPTPQIQFPAGPLLSDHGDVDLRQLPEGDVDLRRGAVMPVVNAKRDTDLRGRQFGDTDLRRMPPGEIANLPFRPVPPPEPATEIDASINSHPPITFRLIPVSPRDGGSNVGSVYLKLSRGLLPTPDSMGQVQNDPRMRKVLRLDEVQEESLPTVVAPTTTAPATIGSPPATTTPVAPRIDPRRARPNNPPSPPKPVMTPAKDPRSVQTMSEVTPTTTFTPDPRLAMRTVVQAESPLIKHPPIMPSPHGIFLPNVNMGNMMGTAQSVDNMGMMPMNVNAMGQEMPPGMGMVSGEEMGGMNRGMGVRGALLMDPVPEYEEYEEDGDGEGMGMYQDGGYGNIRGGRCNMMMEQMPQRGFYRGRGRRGRGRGVWERGHRGRGDGGRGMWQDTARGKGRGGRRGHALSL